MRYKKLSKNAQLAAQKLGLTFENATDYVDRFTFRLHGSVVFHGFEQDFWKWLEEDKPAGLDRDKVVHAVEMNQKNGRNREFSYSIDLPNWDHFFHVGAFVRTKNGNRYSIVDIVGDWAVVVSISTFESPAVCAHTIELSRLEPFDLARELEELRLIARKADHRCTDASCDQCDELTPGQ